MITNCNILQQIGLICNETGKFKVPEGYNDSCINWNQYYKSCLPGDKNPFQGTISFDNIGMAWVAIFLVSFTDFLFLITS